MHSDLLVNGDNLGHTKLISCFWSYKSLKNDQATRLFFGNQSGKKKVYIQTAKCIVEGTRLQNADNCASKEPSLDGEATECRLCKHCGYMLNTDYI